MRMEASVGYGEWEWYRGGVWATKTADRRQGVPYRRCTIKEEIVPESKLGPATRPVGQRGTGLCWAVTQALLTQLRSRCQWAQGPSLCTSE